MRIDTRLSPSVFIFVRVRGEPGNEANVALLNHSVSQQDPLFICLVVILYHFYSCCSTLIRHLDRETQGPQSSKLPLSIHQTCIAIMLRYVINDFTYCGEDYGSSFLTHGN